MLDLAERSPLWPVVIRKLWTALSEPVLRTWGIQEQGEEGGGGLEEMASKRKKVRQISPPHRPQPNQ